MDKLPLNVPRFQQKQVLQMASACSAKDLQNWLTRGIIPHADKNPGKQGRRLWSPAGVIFLQAMSYLTKLNIPPSEAADLAAKVSGHAQDIYDQYPYEKEEDGSLVWAVSAELMGMYHRAYVFKVDGTHRVMILSGGLGIRRTVYPEVYITIEVDVLIFRLLNLMHQSEARIAASKISKSASELFDEATASLVELQSRFEGPGSK